MRRADVSRRGEGLWGTSPTAAIASTSSVRPGTSISSAISWAMTLTSIARGGTPWAGSRDLPGVSRPGIGSRARPRCSR